MTAVVQWARLPVKHLYRVRGDRAGSAVDLPLLSVSLFRGVVPRSELTGDEPRADDLSNYKRCAPGDIVLNRMSAYQGALGISHHHGIVSPDYLVLTPNRDVESRFLTYLFRSQWFVAQMAARVRGIGSIDQGNVRTPRIGPDSLGGIDVPWPPGAIQREVADFLDAETARIDALIAKKRRMIEVLDERRRAVFDRLTVPSALGGVADAGKSHWPITALKRTTTFFTDGDWIESPFITTQGIRLIQTGNVAEGEYREQGDRYISENTFIDLKCTEVHPGDVLISRLAGPVGCACLAPDLGVRMVSSVDVVILRPSELVDPEFLIAYLTTSRHLAFAEILARGTTMQRLSRSQVGGMLVPVPPLEEQRRVVEEVSWATACIKAARGALRRQLVLLAEHRQALITAAVTGQLPIPA